MDDLTCFKGPMAEEFVLELLLTCLEQVRVSLIIRPSDFEELTLCVRYIPG